jgi:hypothetical protein
LKHILNRKSLIKAAEAATLASVASIDLPSEKVLWMNRLLPSIPIYIYESQEITMKIPQSHLKLDGP